MKVLLATRNAGKLAELRRMLADGPFEVLGLADVPEFPEAPETGATFAENALAKARDAASATGLPAVADDSGLAVDALNGMPGVLSARWAGRIVRTPRGSGGFGYDPIFVPDGEERTSAELTSQEKDAASHRGRAMRALLPHLHALT